MATVRGHLKELHEKSEAYHRKLAKLHRALSEHHSTMADLHGDSEHGRLHKAAGESHEEIAAAHEDMREHHDDCLKSLGDLETIKTAAGSGIAPRDPNFNAGVRKVTPAGQPADQELEDLPVEFAELVKTE